MTLPFSQPSWFSSEDFASMTLNNVAGSLLEVIRGCAVTGYNPHPVTSIVVNAGVAVASCADHGYTATYGKLLLIAGASEPLLNGRKQPTAVLTNSFTFPAPGVADGTYTGSISARRAPLGWVEAHTGTNVAIFGRSVPEATAMLLRVDDSHVGPSTATDARIRMVESATDIDTFTGPAPTDEQVSGGLFAMKGANTTTAKKWAVVGCDRAFWLMTEPGTTGLFSPHVFGDGVPHLPGDAYFCFLSANASVTSGVNNTSVAFANSSLGVAPSSSANVSARGASGAGGATAQSFAGIQSTSTFGSNTPAMTTSREMVAVHQPVYIQDLTRVVRGQVPGLAQPLAGLVFGQLEVVQSSLGSSDAFLSVRTTSAGSGPGNGLFNLSSPWY